MKIEITDTAYGGSGVGRASDGKVYFVPFTVEGDVAEVKAVREKGSYTEARLVELIKPSDHRTEPHCPYYGICGGCNFGHIAREGQLAIKTRFAASVLRKWTEPLPEVETIHGEADGYRIRATFRVQNGALGFFRAGSRDFVPVEACPIISPDLFAKAKLWAEQTGGDSSLLSLAVMEAPDGKAIALAVGDKAGKAYAKQVFDGLMMNGKLDGDAFLSYETAYGAVGVGYGGFFQSNRFLNEIFQRTVVDMAGGAQDIMELYAGSGFFTAGLAKMAEDVIGYELAPEAVSLGKHFGYPIFEKDATEAFRKHVNTLVMDPPREGCSKKLMQLVAERLPRRIIYISCNPATAARDLLGLKDSYQVRRRVMVDMFPHSHHTESIHLLKLKP